jgi:hypothetical protein
MCGKMLEDELDKAAAEFINTFNDFKKAAKKLMVIMESINEKNYRELRGLPEGIQESHKFLIQIIDESGQVVEKCFGIRCVAGEEKKQG